MSQASHELVQARSQQIPSGAHTVPATQPAATAWQLWPRRLLHEPAMSQVPAQLSLSAAFSTGEQAPVAQVMQVPVHAELQQ
jgi:hypothetical protein